jgi:hypothetical protein
MKTLLIYIAISEAIPNFYRSMAMQYDMLPASGDYERVVVTGLEDDIACPFPILHADVSAPVNMSKAINFGLAYSQEIDADCAVILGADVVLTTPIVDPPPFSALRICYTIGATPSRLGGCFVLRKELLGYRFHEEYHGWGLEDTDFEDVVLWSHGYVMEEVGYVGFHLPHPPRSWLSDCNRNRELLKRRIVEAMRNGMPYPDKSKFPWSRAEREWIRAEGRR